MKAEDGHNLGPMIQMGHSTVIVTVSKFEAEQHTRATQVVEREFLVRDTPKSSIGGFCGVHGLGSRFDVLVCEGMLQPQSSSF